MIAHAAAKINLSLEIVGKRADGYHDLVSVMREVSLTDELSVGPANDIVLEAGVGGIAVEENLVSRAARLMHERFAPGRGARLRLAKHIPVAAGLGGGSSDAAATLRGLSEFWGVAVTCTEYIELAASLGSDVTFFLYGGTALVEGRGEQVTPLPAGQDTWYVLVNPGFRVSTAKIFSHVPSNVWGDAAATRTVAARAVRGEEPGFGVNSLQSVLFSLYPAAERCFQCAHRLAPGRTIVSGSGPTVVAWFDTDSDARRAAADLTASGYWAVQVRNRARGDAVCP